MYGKGASCLNLQESHCFGKLMCAERTTAELALFGHTGYCMPAMGSPGYKKVYALMRPSSADTLLTLGPPLLIKWIMYQHENLCSHIHRFFLSCVRGPIARLYTESILSVEKGTIQDAACKAATICRKSYPLNQTLVAGLLREVLQLACTRPCQGLSLELSTHR